MLDRFEDPSVRSCVDLAVYLLSVLPVGQITGQTVWFIFADRPTLKAMIRRRKRAHHGGKSTPSEPELDGVKIQKMHHDLLCRADRKLLGPVDGDKPRETTRVVISYFDEPPRYSVYSVLHVQRLPDRAMDRFNPLDRAFRFLRAIINGRVNVGGKDVVLKDTQRWARKRGGRGRGVALHRLRNLTYTINPTADLEYISFRDRHEIGYTLCSSSLDADSATHGFVLERDASAALLITSSEADLMVALARVASGDGVNMPVMGDF